MIREKNPRTYSEMGENLHRKETKRIEDYSFNRMTKLRGLKGRLFLPGVSERLN